jgi:uncharacterized phage protein (TIGR02218 family)
VKTATPLMINNLAAYKNFWIANLIRIICLDGTEVDYTDFESDIIYWGLTFSSRGPRVEFSGFSQKIGVEVDETKIKLMSVGSNVIESQAVLQFIGQGGMDGAFVMVFRAMMPNPNDGSVPHPIKFDTSMGAPIVFAGFVADITNLDRSSAELSVKSRKELLNIPFPYATYQASCRWPLYGVGCTLSQAAFVTAGVVAGVSGVPLLFQTNLPQADDYFDEGVITFTSGLNNGVTRTVRLYLNTSGEVLLFYPLPHPPLAGDTFNIYPGCDKQKQTCVNKFANGNNFGGFRFIPPPEAGV